MLFVPTSGLSMTEAAALSVAKGQIYNLDRDEKVWFQFNPETFETSQGVKWARIQSLGSRDGGDRTFLYEDPEEFDLPLLFLAYPAAPKIEYESKETRAVIWSKENLFDFDELLRMFQGWRDVVPGKRRPSLLGVIVGREMFEGIATEWRVRRLDWFEDGRVRKALITITFETWGTRAV